MQLMGESTVSGEKSILISPKRPVSANQCLRFFYMAKDESDSSRIMVKSFLCKVAFPAEAIEK